MAELDDKVIVTKDKITTIADTIREEGGTSDLMTLDEMPDNIRAISGGGSADVKRLGITLANNTATFNLNGYEIWQLIGSNKTIVADITYTDGNNSTSYNKSCTALLKSEAGDTQTRIEASVMIYKNYTFYTRYFNMVIGASSMEYTGTYAVTDIVIPEEQYVDPLFTLTYPSTITCNKTFAEISSYYGAGNTRPVAPQLIYKHSSDDDTAFRSVYGEVEQYDEDTFIFKFNMGYARGVGKTQWQERIIEIEYASGNLLTKNDDYIFEYQKPIVEGDGINITTEGLGNNRKSKISVDSSMIMIGNASGSVASIVDGADDIPLKSCMVAIEPVQSGSGDPSPSNVRPITGWTECNVTRTRKNLFNPSLLLEASGWSVDTNGVYSGNAYNLSQLYHHNQGGFPIKFKENTQYTITFQGKCDGTSGTGLILFYSYSDGTFSQQNITASENLQNYTFTSTAGKTVVELNCSYSSNIKTYIKNLMLEIGSTATDYEPYQANTYNIEFPSEAGTVYGGTLDVTNGVLTVTDGYIASYNGETLPSTWISSMDVYAEGTTPTTGAEVVYKLATPQTYNVTPTEIKTLLGINNIFADTGDIENVEYTRDATSIINWLISQINLGA